MKVWLIFALALSLSCTASQAQRLQGKVVGVTDGDTLTVLAGQTQYKIRLAAIDAPEKGQPFGTKAKQMLSELVYQKEVQVRIHKKDRYGRFVGQVFVADQDVGLSMIEAGLAWHYKQYQNEQSASDRKRYAEAEIVARENKAGLWVQDAQAPWEWRR